MRTNNRKPHPLVEPFGGSAHNRLQACNRVLPKVRILKSRKSCAREAKSSYLICGTFHRRTCSHLTPLLGATWRSHFYASPPSNAATIKALRWLGGTATVGTCSPSAQLPRVNVVLVQLNKALSIKTSNLPAPLSRNAHPRARLALFW